LSELVIAFESPGGKCVLPRGKICEKCARNFFAARPRVLPQQARSHAPGPLSASLRSWISARRESRLRHPRPSAPCCWMACGRVKSKAAPKAIFPFPRFARNCPRNVFRYVAHAIHQFCAMLGGPPEDASSAACGGGWSGERHPEGPMACWRSSPRRSSAVEAPW